MTRVKICGITRVEDALAAVAAGADALGFVFADSPRRVPPATAAAICRALPPFVATVGVFADANLAYVNGVARELRLTAVQLHGSEPPYYCARVAATVIKRFDVRPEDSQQRLRDAVRGYDVAAYLLDPGRGSGRTFDWSVARELSLPLIVSGGLTAGNVGDAVRRLRPYAVDVSSGVEVEPGRKDAEKMRAFVAAVRRADADLA